MISRFYGFDYNEITNMDADIFMMYHIGVGQIRSEEMLFNMAIADYPTLKQDARKKLHKNIFKNAFPLEVANPKNVVRLGDLNKVLK